MTTRTLRTWRRQDPREARPRIGRPPHARSVLRSAMREVRRQMKCQGKSIGEPAVMAVLWGSVPRRLVRRALSEWKKHDKERASRRAEALRTRIVPLCPGVMASMDVAQLGRLAWMRGAALKAAQVVDVESGLTCAAHVGVRIGGAQVAAMLERMCVQRGAAPLVLVLTEGATIALKGAHLLG